MRKLLLIAVLLSVVCGPSAARAQDREPVSSVSLRPASTTSTDPNDGQWFVGEGAPGDELRFVVVVTNVSAVEQRVSMYLADLRVGDDGVAVLGERGRGLAGWGGFARPELVLPAHSEQRVPFTVTVPDGAEPGDHLAAVVAESAAGGDGAVQVINRIANRFYVTVPGDARAGIEVVSVDVDPERAVLPRWATVTVTLRNTGGVRLAPRVMVEGARAAGSDLLMSRSMERYVVRKRVSVWGGPVAFDVDVRTRTLRGRGPAVNDRGTAFVFPVLLVLLVVLAVIGVLSARRLPRRRDRVDELAAELRRLEQELAARDRVS